MGKRATVAAVAMDPNYKVPVVLLEVEGDERFIPIWIGLMEASAIMAVLEGEEIERPMTHDLLCSLLQLSGWKVQRVVVSDIRERTYFSEISLANGENEEVVDSRPSDAIAIALRTGAEIWIHDRVLSEVQLVDGIRLSEDDSGDPVGDGGESVGIEERAPASALVEGMDTDEDEMIEMLEKLSPDDFKYKM